VLSGLVAGVDRAMLVRPLGFVVTGAAAAIDGGFAINLSEKRIAAVGHATSNDAKRAAFAHGRSGFPARVNPQCAYLTEAGRCEFSESLQKVSGDASRVC
jgi:hypothetical protein